MTKKQSPIKKPWVSLADVEKPFDQTNGVVNFDAPDSHDATNVEADLFARGVASNAINVGFGF